MRKGLKESKELHEGDCFFRNGHDFELLWWDPMDPTDPEYGIASMVFSELYAPDLEMIIGFVPQGSTRKDVEEIIDKNFWKVQERIDMLQGRPTVNNDQVHYKFYRCRFCDRSIADSEILLLPGGSWQCPACDSIGEFDYEGEAILGSKSVRSNNYAVNVYDDSDGWVRKASPKDYLHAQKAVPAGSTYRIYDHDGYMVESNAKVAKPFRKRTTKPMGNWRKRR